jgi:hypothetical protein
MPGVVSLAQDRINLCQSLADGRLERLCCLNDRHLDLDLLSFDHAEVFVEFDRFSVDFAMRGLRHYSSSCSSSAIYDSEEKFRTASDVYECAQPMKQRR